LFFPFSLPSWLSLSSHPSILNITIVIITSYKILIVHSTGTVTIARTMMGRQKKEGNQLPSSNKLVQEPEGNEENRNSDPDANKMNINYAKEPNEALKNNLKEEILQVINENFIEMILDMVNQNVQETLKKFPDNKNREFEKAQEQVNETIEAL
jgi:hypothetical protein